MTEARPSGYSRAQIMLHWIVALFVIFQIVGHEAMVAVFDARTTPAEVSAIEVALAQIHVFAGIAIWVFALWRMVLRFRRGTPAAPAGQSKLQGFVADAVHVVLYVSILLMPISGALAWFFDIEAAANAHSMARFVLLPAVLLHVAGALVQHFWLKTNVLRRMMVPEN